MHKPDYAVVKNVLVVGALVLASLPVSAQRISADTVKNGHFPGALRGHFDAHPDKSFHHLSTGGSSCRCSFKTRQPAAAHRLVVLSQKLAQRLSQLWLCRRTRSIL